MTINLKNFLKPKGKMSKIGEFQELQQIAGLEISAVSADLYNNGRDDLTLFYFSDGANYSSLYTSSSIVSESISWNRKTKKNFIKALLVNTKNANTFTGSQGEESLRLLSKTISRTLTLRESQSDEGASETVKTNEIIFASTGVIGEKFPVKQINDSVPHLVEKLRNEQSKFVWLKAASSIMTTDTKPKLAYEECQVGSKTIRIAGIAKGSGMIAPNLATMLSFIFTDADIPSVILKGLLNKAFLVLFQIFVISDLKYYKFYLPSHVW